MAPILDPFINPYSIGSTGAMLALACWMIKRWINGTIARISKVEQNKVDVILCDTKRASCEVCFDAIKSDINEIKDHVEKLTGNIPVLAENQKTVTENQAIVLRILDKISKRQG